MHITLKEILMTNIVPCDDCGKDIDVSHLGAKQSDDRFVCKRCQVKYRQMEQLIAMYEREGQTIQ